jgi:hypothetical protein
LNERQNFIPSSPAHLNLLKSASLTLRDLDLRKRVEEDARDSLGHSKIHHRKSRPPDCCLHLQAHVYAGSPDVVGSAVGRLGTSMPVVLLSGASDMRSDDRLLSTSKGSLVTSDGSVDVRVPAGTLDTSVGCPLLGPAVEIFEGDGSSADDGEFGWPPTPWHDSVRRGSSNASDCCCPISSLKQGPSTQSSHRRDSLASLFEGASPDIVIEPYWWPPRQGSSSHFKGMNRGSRDPPRYSNMAPVHVLLSSGKMKLVVEPGKTIGPVSQSSPCAWHRAMSVSKIQGEGLFQLAMMYWMRTLELTQE